MLAGAHEGGFARLSQRGKWREGSALSKGPKNKLTRVKGQATPSQQSTFLSPVSIQPNTEPLKTEF